jgi:hypothetical protein
MAWSAQWSLKIDGSQLNDKSNYYAEIPELDTGSDHDIILVNIAGDYPLFVRAQPMDATMNLLIQMTPCNWATYRTRLATLQALLTPGRHTLEVQVRGMTAAKTMMVVVKGMAIEAKTRKVAVTLIVPKPVLA